MILFIASSLTTGAIVSRARRRSIIRTARCGPAAVYAAARLAGPSEHLLLEKRGQRERPVPRAALHAAAARADPERRDRSELHHHAHDPAERRTEGLRALQEQAGRLPEGRAQAVEAERRTAFRPPSRVS